MNTDRIGIFDAKTRFSELVDRVVREGRSITITRRGEPVVEITPVTKHDSTTMTAAEAAEELRNLRSEVGSMSAAEIIELVQQGRR